MTLCTTAASPAPATTAPRRNRAAALLATAAAVTVGLTGCGLGNAMVGVHAAPPEVTTGAPLSATGAQIIADRVLKATAAAQAVPGAEGDKQRAAVMTGSALALATAGAKLPAPGEPAGESVEKPAAPKVLAVSRGRSWPRAMFVETTRAEGSQTLNLLVCEDANSQFQLAASATMQPGASVPALDPFPSGSAVNPDTKGLVGQPGALLTEYAAAVAYPKPKTPAHFDLGSDQFAMVLRRNAAAQAKALGSLATFTQRHTVDPKRFFAFRLRSGGVVVFALMKRTDALKLKPKGKALTPGAELARLLKKKKLTRSATISTYESVVFTVPAQGKAAMVAADEQLISATGS
jgi:hypothetical protein